MYLFGIYFFMLLIVAAKSMMMIDKGLFCHNVKSYILFPGRHAYSIEHQNYQLL